MDGRSRSERGKGGKLEERRKEWKDGRREGRKGRKVSWREDIKSEEGR